MYKSPEVKVVNVESEGILCASNVSIKSCEHCGNTVTRAYRYCPDCGNKIKW